MGSTSVGNLLVLLAIIVLTKEIRAGAYFEFNFIRYTESACRDFFSLCDPKFRFCLDRPRRTTYSASPCFYANSGQSGYYQDTNVIDFSTATNVRGIPNPWLVYANKIMDDSVLFVTEVYDDDVLFDDHMQTWGIILREPVYPSKDESHWTYRTMASGNYRLSFEIRVYCEANYYTSDCSKYCMASDSLDGHYTCEKITGNKICMRGWTGPACTVDIDECSLNFCQRGRCDNLAGDYICHCPPYYSGKNCTIGNNPCEASPCNNNATCTRTGEESFKCLCGKGWEGDTCETRTSSCKSMPCQNSMRCIDSADNSSYICDCRYPTTGVNCESMIPADQSNWNETAGSLSGTSESNSEGFQLWHIIVIVLIALVIILCVIIIIILCIRRRRRRQERSSAASTDELQEPNSGRLVFANNLKSQDLIRSNKKSPLQPVFSISGTDIQEQAKMAKDDQKNVNMSNVKASSEVANVSRGTLGRKTVEKDNYLNFQRLVSLSENLQSREENQYSTLNDMSMSVKNLSKSGKENVHQDDDASSVCSSCLSEGSVDVTSDLPNENLTNVQPSNTSSDDSDYMTPKSIQA